MRAQLGHDRVVVNLIFRQRRHFDIDVDVVIVHAHNRRVVLSDRRLGVEVGRHVRQMPVMRPNHFQFSVGLFAVNFSRQQILEVHDRLSIVRRVYVCNVVGDDFVPNGGGRHRARQVIKVRRVQYLFKHARFTHLSCVF